MGKYGALTKLCILCAIIVGGFLLDLLPCGILKSRQNYLKMLLSTLKIIQVVK